MLRRTLIAIMVHQTRFRYFPGSDNNKEESPNDADVC